MLCIYEVLKGMRERQSGCIINLASRAATIDYPTGASYNSSKAAVARAVGTIQAELDEKGLGEKVHMYSLHPGGVLTAMARGRVFLLSITYYPRTHTKRFTTGENEEVFKMLESLFIDSPQLCGNTCAYLATGRAKEIRGLYFDCRQDIERVCGLGRETLKKSGLYTLKVEFHHGYCNEP